MVIVTAALAWALIGSMPMMLSASGVLVFVGVEACVAVPGTVVGDATGEARVAVAGTGVGELEVDVGLESGVMDGGVMVGGTVAEAIKVGVTVGVGKIGAPNSLQPRSGAAPVKPVIGV